MKGTPKTLEEALANGIKESESPDVIAAHVRDFLAQHLTTLAFSLRTAESSIALQRFAERIGCPFPVGDIKEYD